jgi:hypothetical protein
MAETSTNFTRKYNRGKSENGLLAGKKEQCESDQKLVRLEMELKWKNLV